MKISAGEFKAKCMELLNAVKASGEEIVITKHGRPVAKLVPFVEKPSSLSGFLKNSVTIAGDIVSPLGEKWEAGQDG